METVDHIPSPPSTPCRTKAPAALGFKGALGTLAWRHSDGPGQASVGHPPKSPAEEYRRLRAEKHPGTGSPGTGPGFVEAESASPVRSRASKMPRLNLCCSMCGGACTTHRTVSLGARIAIALVSREFVRALAGNLVACETCAKALKRANFLLDELEKIVVSAPELNIVAAPVLRVQNIRQNIQALAKAYMARRLDIEVQLQFLTPTNGWYVLSAFSDGGKLELLKDPKDNHYGDVELCKNPVDRVTGLVTVQDPIGRTPFKVMYWRLMPLRGPGIAAGVAAAPRAAAAAKIRTAGRLKTASAHIAVLEGANTSLELECESTFTEITRRALETEVSNSSANLEVEKGRAGFAYMQGMGDCNHLLKQLQKLESSIEDLKGDNAKLKNTSRKAKEASAAAAEAQALAAADVARALVIRQNADFEIHEAHSKNERLAAEITKLKKAAKTEMDAMVEATEAQALATADVARALVIRQHAEIEIREAHSKNDILQAEISKLKAAAKDGAKAAKETLTAATEAQAAGKADVARALLIRHQAEREITEVRHKAALIENEVAKLKLENERQRQRLRRDSFSSVNVDSRGSAVHSYSTRGAMQEGELRSSESNTAVAVSLLTEATELVPLQITVLPHLSQLPRSSIFLPTVLHTNPCALAISALFRQIADDLTKSDIVKVVAAIFPAAFFSVAGFLLNTETRTEDRDLAGSTLAHSWDHASDAWHIFLNDLLMTQSRRREVAGRIRLDTIRARQMIICSIVKFTLDPTNNWHLQRPVALLIETGNSVKLHEFFSSAGLSVSHSEHRAGAPVRRAQSTELCGLLLRSWSEPPVVQQLGITTFHLRVRIHIDNIDKQLFVKSIHKLLVGCTRLAPPSLLTFNQKALYDLVEKDFEKTEQHQLASFKAFRSLVSKASTALLDEGAEAMVLRLQADYASAENTVHELELARFQKRPGLKKSSIPNAHSVAELELLLDSGTLSEAQAQYIGHDTLGCEFVIKKGDQIRVFHAFCDPPLAVVEVGVGVNRRAAYVPASVLVDSSSIEFETASADGPSPLAAAQRIDECRANSADIHVQSSVTAALRENSHLPMPSSPCSSFIFGIFDGLASCRSDCDTALKTAIRLVALANPLAQVLVSSDGQPFEDEHKFRDSLRKGLQDEINKLDREIALVGHDPSDLSRLREQRRVVVAKRDAVSMMTPHELGQLHTEMAISRGLWKKNRDACYEGLADRMGLQHALEHMCSCTSGYLSLNIDFLSAIKQAWLMEVLLLLRRFGSPGVEFVPFIKLASGASLTFRVYHRVLCIEASALLDMRASDRMRGAPGKELFVASQKDAALIVAGGGCTRYIKNLVWSLRQELTCDQTDRQLIETNHTTFILETGNNFGHDEFLENGMMKGAVDALGHVHPSNVIDRGAELNVRLGSTTQVEGVMRGTRLSKSGAHGKHGSCLNEGVVIPLARAAMRQFLVPQIEADLLSLLRGVIGVDERTPETVPSFNLPIIPTRAQHKEGKLRPGVARKFNPDFACAEEVERARWRVAVRWALRRSIGGNCESGDSLPAMRPISVFLQSRRDSAVKVKKMSDKAKALLALLSKDPNAKGALEVPSCVVKFINGVPFFNSSSKAEIRRAFRSSFHTCDAPFGASAWNIGSGCKRLRLFDDSASSVVRIRHLLLDGPYVIRLCPPPRRKEGVQLTGADVCSHFLAHVVRPLLPEYEIVSLIDDLGGSYPKLPLEQKRDAEKAEKVVGSPCAQVRPRFNLQTVFKEVPNIASLYGDREWRLEWQAALGEFLTGEEWRNKRDLTLGGVGVATFSGFGSCEADRQRTLTLRCVAGTRVLEVSEPSMQLEDSQLLLEARATLESGQHAEIRSIDTDLLSLGASAISRLQTEGGPLGMLFIRTSVQEVDIGNDRTFKEELFCCNDLVLAIKEHPSLNSFPMDLRVNCIVGLMIFLGGDTTSYLFLPYTLALEWYLQHSDYVGCLVCVPSEPEVALGWSLRFDYEAVVRLTKMLYACRNPTALPGWTSLVPAERAIRLTEISYESLEKLVAREVFPKTMRFMPNPDVLRAHSNRALHRLQTYDHAVLRDAPDLPLIGLLIVMRKGVSDMLGDEQDFQLLEPPVAEVTARIVDGWRVSRVEPIVDRVNRTLAWLFGDEDPAELLIRSKQEKKQTAQSSEQDAGRLLKMASLLAGARTRLKPGSKLRPTVPQMSAVVLAYKRHKGATQREISDIRKRIKGKDKTVAMFDSVVQNCVEGGIPWMQMGAPDELPLGLGSALVDEVDDDSAAASGSEGDESDGEDWNDNEVEEIDTAENEALCELVDEVLASVGASGDQDLAAIGDASTPEETNQLLMEGVRRSSRHRVQPGRFNS